MSASSARGRSYGFAHRGGRAHGPDNSIETFREALARGARGLETDAWVTADGVVVLDHDGVHRAARRRRKPISAVRRDELRAIASLDDLYAECGADFDLAVDVPATPVANAVVAVAARHAATGRLWLVTESRQHLAEWRELAPDLHLAHTTGPHALRRRSLRASRRAGADAVNLRAVWWTRRLVRRAHDEGLLAFAYATQSTWALRRALRQGCDGVFSDHVERMETAIDGRDLRRPVFPRRRPPPAAPPAPPASPRRGT